MKLVNIHKSHLTNALHLQFILQVIKLIRKFNAVLLKIPVLFDNLCKSCFPHCSTLKIFIDNI
jgi:hypothetical protein